ncbi:DNA repair protein XRCC1-like [Acropora palmata]|uniref:DNA repair protein XRCC1-like n=1 Tax=Acropora palmata TaxID=6131 RepID=UPI003DA16C5D
MPLIRPRHVLSFSSEDVAQPAQNMLKSETYRKWRCATGGEKQASVILELERATQIHSIHIGNNGSALVEVLVGRSSWSADEHYQVLLVASSFMSPSESKSFTNTNRVRIFGPDKLSKPVAAQKWDRIKLVCTQPFNKNEQYGLSFVNLHSPPEDLDGDPEEAVASPSLPASSKRLGRFTLNDDSDSEEKKRMSSGSLFFKKFEKKSSPPALSMAAEVRAASIATGSSDDKKVGTASIVRDVRQSGAKERQPVARGGQTPVRDRSTVIKSKVDNADVKASAKCGENEAKRRSSEGSKRKFEDSPKETKSKGRSPPPTKRKRGSPSRNDGGSVPLHEIMKGVVFVLSGFVNPERGNLRDKALQMGAQYKQDWNRECTHLVCAFANTPKFNQVKGKGKIVTKKWIFDSFAKSKRLSTRHYHLPGDSSSSAESSNEEEVQRKRTSIAQDATTSNKNHTRTENENPSPEREKRPIGNTDQIPAPDTKREEPQKSTEIDDIYGGSTDEEDFGKGSPTAKKNEVIDLSSLPDTSPSDPDTEDELRRVQNKRGQPDRGDDDDIFGGQTEGEEEEARKKESADDVSSGSDGELPLLPDFFSHKHFLLYGEIGAKTRRLLIRYITAYNGTLEEYMSDSVEFVITNEDWDQNFDEALKENASLAFVRPKWIIVCHEKGALVPCQPYIVAPS